MTNPTYSNTTPTMITENDGFTTSNQILDNLSAKIKAHTAKLAATQAELDSNPFMKFVG